MKALIASTWLDGGAGAAALRLHEGLLLAGIDSCVVAREANRAYPGVRVVPETRRAWLRRRLEELPLKAYRHRSGRLWTAKTGGRLNLLIDSLQPDVVNLHWVLDGFLSIEDVARIPHPVVWTLHDMWPFTGGCIHSGDCRGYEAGCGSCPILSSSSSRDLSSRVLSRKRRGWKELDLTVVAPSRWMADRARRSAIFGGRPVEVIPNGLDTDVFRPVPRREARARLRLPQDARLVVLGSWMMTQWKGTALLPAMVEELSTLDDLQPLGIVTFGPYSDLPSMIPVYHQGIVNDEDQMAHVYSAADVFVSMSSVETLSYTIMEASACGVPCVAFNVGGIPDLIDHQETGYLATPFDVKDLVRGIRFAIEDPERQGILSSRARRKTQTSFDVKAIALEYADLFSQLRWRERRET